jgi:hypothetical protein
MADRRNGEWQEQRAEGRGRGAGRRDSIKGEHEYVRPHIYREQDREPPPGREERRETRGGRYGRVPRAEGRERSERVPREGRGSEERRLARPGRGSGGELGDRELGRYGRGYEYGGDEDRGRFDQDRREEYRRGGLMRGTSGYRRAGGPGEEYGEGFWSELTRERTRGDFNRHGQRDTLRTQPYDTDRYHAGQYGLGARAGDEWSAREDSRRYGWGEGWSQHQGRDRGYGTRGLDEVDVGELPPRGRPQGRGPRNYQRSDERIREDVCDRLMRAWMDAEDVTVRVHDGEVTLSGTVKSREEKRAIEDLSEDTLGVKEVHNEIRVARMQQPRREERSEEQEGRKLHS